MTESSPHLSAASEALPAPAAPPTRDVLGLPIALTDYGEAIDVMDGMIDPRERGYVCAAPCTR